MIEERNEIVETAVIDVAPVTPIAEQPKKTKPVPITNDIFIRVWNESEYVTDAAEVMGMNPASARARAAKLRTIFAKAGVELNLKKHPKAPRKQKKSLVNDLDELERLAAIANASMAMQTETATQSAPSDE
tara:strand:+ start:26899 stop:27291 length:393 start_codon:yes stop_codon:yes gene_type:complete